MTTVTLLPEAGHVALIAAFLTAIALALVPALGFALKEPRLQQSSRAWASALALGTTLAMACLLYAFWNDDFSVIYVAQHSNRQLPSWYKLSALWSAHEGSLLLWAWLLSLWIFAFAWFERGISAPMKSAALAVQGAVASGFLAFMLFTSNPFLRYLPFSPTDGSDLNPLLQDIGLIIHPPTLYMGYVGFSVAFSLAMASLLLGRPDAMWVQQARRWSLLAWIFLTLGIMLGSWWSYAELGWGGWWFWDPVENASLMPWLAGTALLHSLAVTEKRGHFTSWSLLLAIFAFSLSLLGTFLVRSGVLTSVHAFASDPARGYFILAFLGAVAGGALAVYAFRAPQLAERRAAQAVPFAPVSRETALLFNNVMLVVLLLVVLTGTLYPLVADALHLGKISVGPPYFNFFFVPMATALLIALPFGMRLAWRRAVLAPLWRPAGLTLLASVAAALAFASTYGAHFSWAGFAAASLALWALLFVAGDGWRRWRTAPGTRGMVVAHLGFVVALAGMALTSVYSESRDVRMDHGQPVALGELTFVLDGVTQQRGPNYVADVGDIRVMRDGREVAHLHPEKRSYFSDRANRMTEAAIAIGAIADIYVSMGEPLDKAHPEAAWAVRLHVKPFVRWIWAGAILMALGAALSRVARRQRVSAEESES